MAEKTPNRSPWLLRSLVALVAAAIAAGVYADWYRAAPPEALQSATFVGRSSCVQCHQQEHDDWTGSHHDKAMDLATEESVLGDFDNATFERLGVTTRFFRDGDRFMVNTEGPDGEFTDFEVKYTFGVDPLQQYMIEFPDGRVQVLRVSWDTHRKEWFYLPLPDSPEERLAHDDPFHWTGVYQNWNTTCAICHSTNLQKNYDPESNTYDTTWSEIDVSCEECHGPASLHVELASANSLFWDRRHGYGLAKLKSLDSGPQLETCAKCHTRHRDSIHPEFRPGRPLLDYHAPDLLRETLYHTDGQILDEVYVYGSFLQSKMHAKGVRCTDCHNPHSLELEAPGNLMCAKCHEPAKYDVEAHHHHPVGSESAQCVSCHMPSTTYMVVDPRRDHSFRVPRPDLTVSTGAPNVCNRCHQEEDETAEWAAAKVREWYGDKRADDPHWAPAFAAGRRGDPEGEAMLVKLARRETAPAIVRATAIQLLAGYGGQDSLSAIRRALDSPEPLIRLAAVQSAKQRGDSQLIKKLPARLNDPARLVRIEAARQLVGEDPDLSDDQFDNLIKLLDEYRELQALNNDRAAYHRNLANLARELNDRQGTIKELRAAIKIEPYFRGVRDELMSALDPVRDAEEIAQLRKEEILLLERDIGFAPDNAYFRYRLGVLLAVERRLEEAAASLAEACRLAPQQLGFHTALAVVQDELYTQTGDPKHFDAAVETLQRLNEIRRNNPDARNLLRKLIATRERFNAEKEKEEVEEDASSEQPENP